MYTILKNRMTNHHPFLKSRALEEIEKIALDLTVEQVAELRTLAEKNGVDAFPATFEDRLNAIETTQLEQDAALMELAMMIDGGAM